jgi:hypothetical protein
MMDEKLKKLGQSISAGAQAKRDRKTSDWARVQTEHPDQAHFISAIGAVFGKPKHVQVKTDSGDVILDSSRYE